MKKVEKKSIDFFHKTIAVVIIFLGTILVLALGMTYWLYFTSN